MKSSDIPGRLPLNSLKEIPIAGLMRMVPVVRHGWRAHVCKRGVVYQDSFGREGVIHLGKKARAAVLQFDGIRSLEQVASILENEFELTQVRSWSIVRKAFLKLAMRKIYHPSVSIDPAQTHQKMESQNA